MIINNSKYNQSWQTKTLNELGTFKRGKSKHRPRNDKALFENGKYPLIQTGEIKNANLFINNHTDTYNDFGLKQSELWPKNTLCITIAANIAETAILNYPMCFPDSVVGFNAYDNESSELFMHYVFTFIKATIQNAASGSIQDNINIDFLTNLNFKIPEKGIQDIIAKVLSDLDAKIELNNKINAELEAMAKTLYDYWFVQFDFPNADGKPYKTSGGTMVWNEELKREIPLGWEVKNIGDYVKSSGGYAFKSSEWTESGLPVVKIKDIQEDYTLNLNDISHVSFSTIVDRKFIAEAGEVVIAMTGATVGKYAIIPYTENEILVNQRVGIFKTNGNPLDKLPFLINSLNQKYFRESVFTLASGAAQPNISNEQINSIPLLLPTNAMIQSFNKKLKPNYLKILSNQKENQQLASLRDWLLPMLMNGQVSVGDVAEELGMVKISN